MWLVIEHWSVRFESSINDLGTGFGQPSVEIPSNADDDGGGYGDGDFSYGDCLGDGDGCGDYDCKLSFNEIDLLILLASRGLLCCT